MESFYSTTNNNTTRQIYNIIDDLEKKLTNRGKSKKLGFRENLNYDLDMTDIVSPYYQRPQINSFRNNSPYYQQQIDTNQSQVIPQNLTLNQSLDVNNIRKIIKEEFSNLIAPYQNDLNNNISNINLLQNKLDNVSNDLQNEKVTLRNRPANNFNKENLMNEIKNMFSDYVTYTDFNKKILELNGKISANTSDLNLKNNSIQSLNNTFNNELNDIKFKVKNINDDFNDKLNKYINNNNNDILSLKESNNKLLMNEIKLNDVINKNELLKKNFDLFKDEMTNFKTQINLSISSCSEKLKKINDLENSINTFNNLNNKINDYETTNKKLNDEIAQINNNFRNIKTSINNLEGNINKNNMNNDIKNEFNNLNENQNKEIKEIKEKLNKLNINELMKLDINKFNLIDQNYEDSMLKNQEIFRILEQYDTTIKDLNTKLEKLRNDYESESKKKYNQFNERISRVEDEEQLSVRASNVNNANNINEIQTIKGDINTINQKLNNFIKKYEDIETKIDNLNQISGNNLNDKGNDALKNELYNIKDEIQIINNTINNMNKNDNGEISREMDKIKNDIESLRDMVKKNNYMMQIATLNSQIDKIKKDIEFYHAPNQNQNNNPEQPKENMNNNNNINLDQDGENEESFDDFEKNVKHNNEETNKGNDNQQMFNLLDPRNQEMRNNNAGLSQIEVDNPYLINDNPSNNNKNINISNNNNYSNNLSNNNNYSNNFSNNNNFSNSLSNNNNFSNNLSNNNNNNKNSYNLIQNNNNNINIINNSNENNDDYMPKGDLPIPVENQNLNEESKNSLDEYDIEEI